MFQCTANLSILLLLFLIAFPDPCVSDVRVWNIHQPLFQLCSTVFDLHTAVASFYCIYLCIALRELCVFSAELCHLEATMIIHRVKMRYLPEIYSLAVWHELGGHLTDDAGRSLEKESNLLQSCWLTRDAIGGKKNKAQFALLSGFGILAENHWDHWRTED